MPKKTLIQRGIRIFKEPEKKNAVGTRGQREYDIGQLKGFGAGAAAGAGIEALRNAVKEDDKDKGVDLGEGAVVSYEDKEPEKKAKGGRPIGVGAAQRGYGAVMRKSVGGGLRGVGAAQRGFGAVKKAGKE